MKNYLKSWISILLATFLVPVFLLAEHPDNYYGLPGDDFSLEGALDLFKRSDSLEEFERALNSPDNDVNNLDLDYDGLIDYLRVVDHAEGDLHAIVIQAFVGRNLAQDVAVIEVKRNRYNEAIVQIIGDENLYGTAKIVEPYPYDDMVGADYRDYYYDHYSPNVFVNAWLWPSVRFIFAPRYVVWVSPYYYGYYPIWYRTWRPQPRHVWRTRTIVYNNYYCAAPQYRIPEARHFYEPRRSSAPEVHRRTERYVEEHGGRSNFTYGSRKTDANVSRNRSLERSDRRTVATDPNRNRDESHVARPRTNSRKSDGSVKSNGTTNPDRKRNVSPEAKNQTDRRRQETTSKKSSRKTSVASRPAAEKQNPLATTPTRKTQPSRNSNVTTQSSSAKSSPQAKSRSVSKPTSSAPKAKNTGGTTSRSNPSTSSKTPVKSGSSRSRKGKG